MGTVTLFLWMPHYLCDCVKGSLRYYRDACGCGPTGKSSHTIYHGHGPGYHIHVIRDHFRVPLDSWKCKFIEILG